jgi:hypothetical protein
MDRIEVYRREYLRVVDMLMKDKMNHSIWTISCCQHSYACFGDFYDVPAQKIPTVTGVTVRNVVERYVFGG